MNFHTNLFLEDSGAQLLQEFAIVNIIDRGSESFFGVPRRKELVDLNDRCG